MAEGHIATCCVLRVARCVLQDTGCELRVAGCGVRVRGRVFRSMVLGYLSLVTCHSLLKTCSLNTIYINCGHPIVYGKPMEGRTMKAIVVKTEKTI